MNDVILLAIWMFVFVIKGYLCGVGHVFVLVEICLPVRSFNRRACSYTQQQHSGLKFTRVEHALELRIRRQRSKLVSR